jgi:hypothetical protein
MIYRQIHQKKWVPVLASFRMKMEVGWTAHIFVSGGRSHERLLMVRVISQWGEGEQDAQVCRSVQESCGEEWHQVGIRWANGGGQLGLTTPDLPLG